MPRRPGLAGRRAPALRLPGESRLAEGQWRAGHAGARVRKACESAAAGSYVGESGWGMPARTSRLPRAHGYRCSVPERVMRLPGNCVRVTSPGTDLGGTSQALPDVSLPPRRTLNVKLLSPPPWHSGPEVFLFLRAGAARWGKVSPSTHVEGTTGLQHQPFKTTTNNNN